MIRTEPKKTNHRGSNTAFIALGFFCYICDIFYTRDYTEGTLPALVFLAGLAYVLRKRSRENKLFKEVVRQFEARKYAVTLDNEEIRNLIDEAVYVINRALESGLAVSLYSDGQYEGFILAIPESRGYCTSGNIGTYGFSIDVLHVPELISRRDRYRSRFRSPHWSEINAQLDSFLNMFGNRYLADDEKYTYITKNTAHVLHSDRMALRELLYDQVERRCPLADFSGTPIHTKNVARS